MVPIKFVVIHIKTVFRYFWRLVFLILLPVCC